jgi:uncharacterized protein
LRFTFKGNSLLTTSQAASDAPDAPSHHPLQAGVRIAALDVVRGFALIGILLMNIEYFNRATNDMGGGMQTGLSGANHWFSFFVQYFVVGKFWTIFSLLFGMGFAVMLTRAKAAQRSFLVPYLRRIAALAVFGALHFILLWPGDILFSYAVGALMLLMVLYARARIFLLIMLALAGVGLVSGWEWPFVIAGSLAYFGLCAWYLRGPERLTLFKRNVPLFKIVTRLLMLIGAGLLTAGLAIPTLPYMARAIMPVAGFAIVVLSILMVRFHDPEAARPWRIGVGMYVFCIGLATAISAMQYYRPDPADAVAATMALPAKPAKSAPDKAVAKAPETDLERALERRREMAEQMAEEKSKIAHEVKVLTRGSYADAVAMRAREFAEHVPEQFGFATLVITMFLLGTWFVHAGVITNSAAHLPLFRKLAMFALPLGLAMGLAGALIATHGTPGVNDGFGFAFSLLMLGNLPACLGYVGLVVLMLHSRSPLARVAVLAPMGRMALTNYLTHSLVFTTLAYGYGLGTFGMERKWQAVCVLVMIMVQLPLSHWWLARFRYGPVEWLWRAITYWQIPAMRVAAAPPEAGVSSVHP